MLPIPPNPYANKNSFIFKLRQKRFEEVQKIIDVILTKKDSCRILDFGGEQQYWDISNVANDRRIKIDLVNIRETPTTSPQFTNIICNVCDMDDFSDMSYDLVHSNSVIEHVGLWSDMEKMAANVRRLAPSYFVQTPYFWFPIEPHFRFLIYHWLPQTIRYKLIMNHSLGFVPKANTISEAVRSVQHAWLLDRQQFSSLFPDATVKFEKVFGIPKSLMAIRSAAY